MWVSGIRYLCEIALLSMGKVFCVVLPSGQCSDVPKCRKFQKDLFSHHVVFLFGVGVFFQLKKIFIKFKLFLFYYYIICVLLLLLLLYVLLLLNLFLNQVYASI